MAFVNLDSIHHFQPLHPTGRPVKGRSAAWKRGASTVSNEHSSPPALALKITASAGLKDYGLIESVDLTDNRPMETMNLFGEPALDFGSTEVLQAQGKAHCPLVSIGRLMTTSRSPLD